MSDSPIKNPSSGHEAALSAEAGPGSQHTDNSPPGIRVPETRVNGQRLADMVGAASDLLESHSHIVNALNVFPVPDGDTGTNMSLTMRAVAAAAREQASTGPEGGVGDVARAMARRALMEARGNSGVILSQFFRGISEGFDGLTSFGPADLAKALTVATERSYGGVGEPVEGTMLTVIAAAADQARVSASAGMTVPDALEAVCERARETVAATQAMLPVLAEAGVVDAGGFGVQLILRGMTLQLAGEQVEGVEVPVPGGAVVDSNVALRSAFLDQADHGGFGFCTQILVDVTGAEVAGPDLGDVRLAVGRLASSVVVVGDAELVKIHAHTAEPDELIAYAESLGLVIDSSAQDMDEQETAFSAGHRTVTRTVGNISLVAMASGNGLIALFTDLGTFEVIDGGRTKNPSVKDIAEAIERAPTRDVIVLPNDNNVVPAARQAADLSGKNVGIVPTVSIQQGVAAALALNSEADLDSNTAAMVSAVAAVRSGEVTIASRDVTLDGITTVTGAFIGILDGTLVASGPGLSAVLDGLIRESGAGDDDLITLFRGKPVAEPDAAREMARLVDQFDGVEFELVDGGQPHYHYLLSIE
jgi:DAK2 domain fusion protein YloV